MKNRTWPILIDALIMDINAGSNSLIRYFNSQVDKGSNLQTDLLLILSTVAMSSDQRTQLL